MIIHKDCYSTIIKVWLGGALSLFLIFMFIPWAAVAYILATIPLFVMGFVMFFFRVPQRNTVPGEKVVTSVADGRVVVVEKVFEAEHLNCECMQVSVYMDFFNVHVNYWPIDGEVTYYKYHPGKYMLAYLPKASELNEHTSVGIKSEHGEILFKQLAGTFARRIVCYAKPGNQEVKGDQCGIIKFGSRIDMYLPLDAEIKVQIGDYVRACESVIAELR